MRQLGFNFGISRHFSEGGDSNVDYIRTPIIKLVKCESEKMSVLPC